MDLTTFTDIYDLFALDQVGKQVHQSYKVSQFWQNDYQLFLTRAYRPSLSRDRNSRQPLVLVLPLIDQVFDSSVVFKSVKLSLIESIMDIVFFRIL